MPRSLDLPAVAASLPFTLALHYGTTWLLSSEAASTITLLLVVASALYHTWCLAAWLRVRLFLPTMKWSEEVVVVTGGCGGLGRSIAAAFSARGCQVIVLDMNIGSAIDGTQLADDDNIWTFQCDVSNEEQVNNVASRIHGLFGPVSVLVNNAGIARTGSVLDLTSADIELSTRVMQLAHFWTARAFLPKMIARNHGHIVNVTSCTGFTGVAGSAAYIAPKAGASAFTECLRRELISRYGLSPSNRGVFATVVQPGFIDTGMFAGVKLPQLLAPDLDPDEVASAVVSAVEARCDGDVRMPFYAKLIPLYPLLPIPFRNLVSWITGADATTLTHQTST